MKKISFKAWTIVLILSLIFDFFTVLPFVGSIAAPIFWFSFNYYMWRSGYGLVNWRRLFPSILSFIIEIIPAIQSLPSIFAAIIIIIGLTKLEEKTGLDFVEMTKKNTPARQKRIPLYNNGVRLPNKTYIEENSVNEE